MKKLCAVFLCVVFLFLTGCWDQKELNEIGIVTGIAIDRDSDNGDDIITIQVVLPANLQKNAVTNEKPYMELSGEGKTLFDAERDLSKKYERAPFFSHNRIIIVSEDVAQNGMQNVLDWFSRDIESNDRVMLVIAKDKTAKQVLDYDNKTEKIPSLALSKFDKVFYRNPGSIYKTILEFNQSLYTSGINPVLGVFTFSNNTKTSETGTDAQKGELQFTGGAVFIHDKLHGFLDADETTAYNYIVGKIKSGTVDINSLQNKNEVITMQILSEQSSIEPHFDHSQISFDIKITDYAGFGELHDSTDVTDIEAISKLENEMNEKIESSAEAVIKKMQTNYKSDIFGFGNSIYKKNPAKWDKIENKWPQIYPTVHCRVIVKSTIVRSGMTDKKNKIG